MAGKASLRSYSSRSLLGLKKWFFGSETTNIETQHTPLSLSLKLSSQEDIEKYIKDLTLSFFPESESEKWAHVCLVDTSIKSKVLLSCEESFHRKIPNKTLNTLKTMGDVLAFFSTPSRKPPGVLFPNIRENLTNLPPNLSMEFPPKRQPNTTRKPFQNYNDNSHMTFPNKKQKHHKY